MSWNYNGEKWKELHIELEILQLGLFYRINQQVNYKVEQSCKISTLFNTIQITNSTL